MAKTFIPTIRGGNPPLHPQLAGNKIPVYGELKADIYNRRLLRLCI
jgi:hypothetical protein